MTALRSPFAGPAVLTAMCAALGCATAQPVRDPTVAIVPATFATIRATRRCEFAGANRPVGLDGVNVVLTYAGTQHYSQYFSSTSSTSGGTTTVTTTTRTSQSRIVTGKSLKCSLETVQILNSSPTVVNDLLEAVAAQE